MEAAHAQPNSGGSFTTIESLLTFPGATAAIKGAWELSKLLPSPKAGSVLIPIGLAVLLGFGIYLWNVTGGGMTRREKVGAAVVALVNTVFLASAAIGVAPAAQGAVETVSP